VARGVHEGFDELLDLTAVDEGLGRVSAFVRRKPRFARSFPCWFGAMSATKCMSGSNRPSPLLLLAECSSTGQRTSTSTRPT